MEKVNKSFVGFDGLKNENKGLVLPITEMVKRAVGAVKEIGRRAKKR
ncbi:MAG: hypothetical protein WC784_04120 [Candidatus Shapirobacteria bacterium]|jgi:hypothetical protein